MSHFFKVEILEFAGFLRRNKNEIAVVALGTLFLVLARYHHFEPRWLRYLVFYLSLPAISIALVLKKNPLDFGLKFGNVKLWRWHVAIACGVTLILVYTGSKISVVNDYYSPSKTGFLSYAARWALILFSLEFFYRGFLVFGLREKLGEGAIFVQMVPFTLLHIGKPEVETVGCIVTGIYFGYLAYRSNSCWPVFLIHLFANLTNKFINVM
jgi:hypothetical protein